MVTHGALCGQERWIAPLPGKPTADHEEERVLMHGVTRKRLMALLASGTLAAAAFGAPAASARDDTIASFDGTTIALHFFGAAGLAPGAKAPTVMFGPGWGSGGATDP